MGGAAGPWEGSIYVHVAYCWDHGICKVPFTMASVEGWQQSSEARGHINMLLARRKRKQPCKII